MMSPSVYHRRVRVAIYAALGFLVALLTIWLLFVTVALLQQAKTNGRIAATGAQAAQRVEDCTTPGNACYQVGEDRLARAIDGVQADTIRAVAAGISCRQDGVRGTSALTDCIRRRLFAQERREADEGHLRKQARGGGSTGPGR